MDARHLNERAQFAEELSHDPRLVYRQGEGRWMKDVRELCEACLVGSTLRQDILELLPIESSGGLGRDLRWLRDNVAFGFSIGSSSEAQERLRRVASTLRLASENTRVPNSLMQPRFVLNDILSD